MSHCGGTMGYSGGQKRQLGLPCSRLGVICDGQMSQKPQTVAFNRLVSMSRKAIHFLSLSLTLSLSCSDSLFEKLMWRDAKSWTHEAVCGWSACPVGWRSPSKMSCTFWQECVFASHASLCALPCLPAAMLMSPSPCIVFPSSRPDLVLISPSWPRTCCLWWPADLSDKLRPKHQRTSMSVLSLWFGSDRKETRSCKLQSVVIKKKKKLKKWSGGVFHFSTLEVLTHFSSSCSFIWEKNFMEVNLRM